MRKTLQSCQSSYNSESKVIRHQPEGVVSKKISKAQKKNDIKMGRYVGSTFIFSRIWDTWAPGILLTSPAEDILILSLVAVDCIAYYELNPDFEFMNQEF